MGSSIKNRLIIFLASIIVALIFLVPTFLRDNKSLQIFSKPLSLGLDLSGGVYLVYEVLTEEAVKSKLQSTLSAMRAELRDGKIAVNRAKVLETDQVELLLQSDTFAEKAQALLDEKFRGEMNFVSRGMEGGRAKLVYGVTPAQAQNIKIESVRQAVETLRNRIDQFGVAEPLIQRVGDRRIMLQMPGVSDIQSVKNVVGKTAKLEFRLTPAGGAAGSAQLKDKAGLPVAVEDQTLMTGDAVGNARVDMVDGQVEVLLTLTGDGRRTFGRITSENVGRQLAIILDGVVYSAPVIRDAITQGTASISGGFTFEEARMLAVVLRAGALPAPLKVVEERTVGPSLGLDSIKSGVLAICIGMAAVAIFMLAYYKKAGALAVLSLALNLFLILAALSAFGATLTLPGLAGLALTIGMAVDSNVIIFERIKDELKLGKSRDAAVSSGFEKAFSAILDSNVTTFLASLLLYFFGTGPIRGFAITLASGILTTVYCATFVSRLGFDSFKLKGSRAGLSI